MYSNGTCVITYLAVATGLFNIKQLDYGWEIAQKMLLCGFLASPVQVCKCFPVPHHLPNNLKGNPQFVLPSFNTRKRMMFIYFITSAVSLEVNQMALTASYDPSSRR